MNALDWVIVLLALGFLGGTMFTVIRSEDKLDRIIALLERAPGHEMKVAKPKVENVE